MSGYLNMGNESNFQEITSETRGRAVSGVDTTDYFWTEGEAGQLGRYKPFAITCQEPMDLEVVYWGDKIGRDDDPDPNDDTNSVIVHFLEGPNTARLFKIVGSASNTSPGGTAGEIVANR